MLGQKYWLKKPISSQWKKNLQTYFTASHSQSCKLVFPQICRQKSTRTTEHFQNILIHLHNNFFAAGF